MSEGEKERSEKKTLSCNIYKPGKGSMGHGFPRLASAQPINRDGPYKRPTSENGGIFGGGSLIRPASVNRF